MHTTFIIYLPNDKVKYLSEALKEDKMTILSVQDEHTEIKLKLTSGEDILDIFYAGSYATIYNIKQLNK
jgi:hypothetical protein